jgi:hypothetical protein
MGKKITINIRCNIAAPYGYNNKEIDKLISNFFNRRAKVDINKANQKYTITSYRFKNGTNAEIKIKVHYAKEGPLKSFDILGTFDIYKNRTVENINEFRVMMQGFIEYLNKQKFGWFVDVFVFRLYPVDFMRQYESRVGEGVVSDVYLILRIKGADYCIIKGDRVEYRCSDWQTDTIENIMTIISKYTRK